MNTVVYHTQSLRPKSQSVNPPWREKTKLRESDLIGIVLAVIDSVCYGFVVPWDLTWCVLSDRDSPHFSPFSYVWSFSN